MAYGQTHTAIIPTVSSTLGPTYATNINSVLTEMRVTLDAKVTPAGMDMNADLSLRSGATYYGIKDAHRVSLYAQPTALSAVTYPTSLYTNSDGTLYYNDSAGNQIAITTTAGAVAGAAGNITGLASPASIVWNSGASDYEFYATATTFADLKARNILLNDGDTNFLQMIAPAMAADYSLTWPAALPPAVTSLLSVTTAGIMAYTATPTVTTLTTTGALSVGTTSTFTGKATFSVEFAHPQRTRHITPMEMASDNTNFTHVSDNNARQVFSTAGDLFIPLQMQEGERLDSITIWITTSATAGTRYFDIGYYNTGVSAWTYPFGGYRETTATAGTRQAVTLNNTDITVSNPTTSGVGAGFLLLKILGIAGDQVHGVRVNFTRA